MFLEEGEEHEVGFGQDECFWYFLTFCMRMRSFVLVLRRYIWESVLNFDIRILLVRSMESQFCLQCTMYNLITFNYSNSVFLAMY